MPKMNPELKAKWVAALRDPTREQTKGLLRNANAMCCLGVLCDVIDSTEWQKSGTQWSYGDNWDSALPPKAINEAVGFTPHQEALVINGLLSPPQQHNDEHNATFLQIADAIEEQW